MWHEVTRQVATIHFSKVMHCRETELKKLRKSLAARPSAVEPKIGGSNPSVHAIFNFLVKPWLEIWIVVLNLKANQAKTVCRALTKHTNWTGVQERKKERERERERESNFEQKVQDEHGERIAST